MSERLNSAAGFAIAWLVLMAAFSAFMFIAGSFVALDWVNPFAHRMGRLGFVLVGGWLAFIMAKD